MGKRGKRRKYYWSEEEQRFVRKKKRRGGRGRMSEAKRNFKERAGWQNRHHIRNRCRGGDCSTKNILMMDERRHAAFHLLFRNMDFMQVAKLLLRCHAMKNHIRDYQIAFIPINHEEEFHGVGIA